MIGMIGMIIPPEVIGPGATVGSQIGPVCVMRPRSGSSDETSEREVTEAGEEAVEASEEVLDVLEKGYDEEEAGTPAELLAVDTNGKVLDSPAVDGKKEEDVRVRCVVDIETVVPDVEDRAVRVSVPLNHVVLAMRVVEIEDAEPGELSQSQ